MIKKIISILILVCIVAILTRTVVGIYKEARIENYDAEKMHISQSNENNIKKEQTQSVNNTQNSNNLNLVPNTYKGYKVSSKLKIEKLKIDTFVLENYTKASMEIGIVKYFGANPNEVGNYCIAGHNYTSQNIFIKLKDLNIGDKLTLTDNKYGTVEYEVFDKYKVLPTQTSILSQETNGERQITLITCSDYTKKRIIVKARAI